MNVGGECILLALAIPLTTRSTNSVADYMMRYRKWLHFTVLGWPNSLSLDLDAQAFDFWLHQDREGHDEEMMAKCVLHSQLFD
jgi:hypothetical protein